ncbi:MAG TPA: hypothetical protein VGP94_11975 [Tepidisphaeraceae bacterium]|nr:hypothetical protein [Tepidisphaeraceae bacterium]
MRFVPPPYTPERRNQSTQQKGFVLYRQNSISEIDRDYWDWAHRIQPGGLFFGNRLMPSRPIGNLKAAMEFAALGRWPDVVVAEELKDIRADGDWIVRGITSLDQRMMALQSVLKLITGRDLVIQYELVEHEVDDWELSLENRGSLKVIKDRQLHPGIVMRERVAKAGS